MAPISAFPRPPVDDGSEVQPHPTYVDLGREEARELRQRRSFEETRSLLASVLLVRDEPGTSGCRVILRKGGLK
jgi:hypothetical protein